MSDDKPVDERGIPTLMNEQETHSPYCPERQCDLCADGSPVNWSGTNFEWCQMMETCAATIDWDKVYNR